MSYTDPKQIKDNTLGIVSKVAQAGLQNLNAARRADENAVSKNISNIITGAVNAGVKSIAPKQSALNATNRAILKSSQNMYKKIGSSAMDTGYEEFDANNEDFWNQIVSKYNATAQAMKQGTMIDNSRGAQDLAMYENIVDIYAQSVPNIRATAQAITKAAQADHGSGERLSVAGAPAYQLDIIRHAAEGEGNIQIIQRGNNIILFDPNVTYIDENGKEKKGGELNLNEFNRSIEEADGKNPYLKYATNTKPETKQGFDELIKQGVDGTNTPKYVTEKVTKNPNNGEDVSSYSMTPAQQDLFINDQIGKTDEGGYATGNLYELTVEKNGESIWEDQMQGGPDNIQWPDDIPEMPEGDRDGIVEKFGENSEQVKDFDSQAKEYDDFYNTFYEPTLKYLAGQSLQNAEDAGIVLIPRDETTNNTVVEEEEEENNESGSGGSGVEEIKINEENKNGEEEEVVVKKIVKNFYESNPKIEKPVYKNEKDEEVDFEQDSNTFLTNIETTYGGYDGDEGTAGIPSYGDEDDTRVDDHLNSTKVLPGKSGAYFDGTDKKGLKADIGEDVYNALSDSEKAILRMEHLNVGWNPKVLMLQTAGIISKDDRGKYHKPQNQKDPSKWDVNKLYEENKDKIAALLKGKDSVMLENLEAIYKGTDNSKPKNSKEQNKKRNKGYQTQYTKRIADIKKRYNIANEEDNNNDVASNDLNAEADEIFADNNLQTVNSVGEIGGGPGYTPSINYPSNK